MSLLSTPDNSCSLIMLSARHSDQAHRNAPRLLDLLQRDETREPLDPDLRGKHVVHDFAVVINIARNNLEHVVETTADEIALDNELLITHVAFELLRVLESSLAQSDIGMNCDMRRNPSDIKCGAICQDVTGIFEPTHALETRRRRQTDQFGEFEVAHPAIVLQRSQPWRASPHYLWHSPMV